MGKKAHDDVLDAPWELIKANCTKQVACSQEPATFAEANTTYKLAEATMTSGDFTTADGETSGRKMTVAQKLNQDIIASGTMTHSALLDITNSRLLYVTTSASKLLASGDKVNFLEWDAEFGDPT